MPVIKVQCCGGPKFYWSFYYYGIIILSLLPVSPFPSFHFGVCSAPTFFPRIGGSIPISNMHHNLFSSELLSGLG